ncbi:hypothetical protein [Bradyrhizobium sp. SEMIA]|uniref:hypothetical protein n=1 Tax=Bradyrhizobium sp. SEMIA TaxID=2597515 RepID=UPI0018A3FD1C|nr:hypothetical protein [Bradyrhizobium sp. SEMIA]QOG17528.1 hypothetical protein FOM02_09405 [Bradyrhizobium sp. SEMIA]
MATTTSSARSQESLARFDKKIVVDNLKLKSAWQNTIASDHSISGGMEWRAAVFISNHLHLKNDHLFMRCNPSHDLLSKEIGCSIRQSKRVVQALIDKGYLECRKVGFGSSNQYTLTIPNGDGQGVTIDEFSNSDAMNVTIDDGPNGDMPDVPSIVPHRMASQKNSEMNNEDTAARSALPSTVYEDREAVTVQSKDAFRPIYQSYPREQRGDDGREALAAFALARAAGYCTEHILCLLDEAKLDLNDGDTLPPLSRWLTTVAATPAPSWSS